LENFRGPNLSIACNVARELFLDMAREQRGTGTWHVKKRFRTATWHGNAFWTGRRTGGGLKNI